MLLSDSIYVVFSLVSQGIWLYIHNILYGFKSDECDGVQKLMSLAGISC